jgi:DNA-binding response OmpR family regulator
MESQNLQNKKIWIVEDDEGILDITSLILREYGYDPLNISEEEKLWSTLEQSYPDLILLDIFLNKSDGVEISRKIKENPKTNNIPIILISADKDIEVKTKNAKANAFIKKPYDMNNLIQLINNCLN